MSVTETDIVDFIGINSDGLVELSISDQLPWDGEHFLMLQEKINTYLSFYESGELYQKYPDSKGKKVIISIIFKHIPSEDHEELLNKFRSVVKTSGLDLVWNEADE